MNSICGFYLTIGLWLQVLLTAVFTYHLSGSQISI